MVIHTDSPRVRTCRAVVLELLASSVDLSHRRRAAGPMLARVRRRRRAASAPTAATVAQPVKDRQRSLRPRLLEVRALLQVRRGVRHRRAEHLRHRRRRPRLRRAHLDRARRAAARLGVRLLRQLHRRVPDRRADVQARVRRCGRPGSGRRAADSHRHHLPVLRRRLHAHRCTCRTTASSGSPRRSTTTSPAATCASRAGSASNTPTTPEENPDGG